MNSAVKGTTSVKRPHRIFQHRWSDWSWNWFWAVIALLVILHIAVFSAEIIAGGETKRVQFVPDDAFYYLGLARNFVALKTWSFDSGVSTATGYHPLLAYILVGIYALLRPSLEIFVIWGMLITTLITLITLLLAWRVGWQHRNPFFLPILALLASSKNVTLNALSVMEWALVILVASLCAFHFYRASLVASSKSLTVLFGLGILGSLARTDFGLWPLGLFGVSLILVWLDRRRELLKASSALLCGACCGVLLVFLHNYIFTGHFLQTSAKVKAYWGEVYGTSYQRVLRVLLETLSVNRGAAFDVLFALSMWAVIATPFIFLSEANGLMSIRDYFEESRRLRELVLVAAALVSLLGYTVAYARVVPVQPWYSANLLVPLYIALVALGHVIEYTFRHSHQRLIRWGLGVLIFAGVLHNLSALRSSYLSSDRGVWPHQQAMLIAGKYLREHPLNGRVGAWNAGIIGYYEGGHVVNLDGLVNDNVYPYIVTNNLAAYLAQQNITYVLDFRKMFTDEKRRRRGGYDDRQFLNSLRPTVMFDNGQYGSWKFLTLYKLSW